MSGEDQFRILPSEHRKIEQNFIIKLADSMPLKDGSLLMSWHETEQHREQKTKLDYATAFMPGYKNVTNLSTLDAWKIFNYKNNGKIGEDLMFEYINKSSPTLLMPLQGGVCPFDCKGCPFALHAAETEGKKTKQLGVEETRRLIQDSLTAAKSNNINIDEFGISFVGSGDATPNPYLEQIFYLIQSEFPQVSRIRFSTVAGDVKEPHLTPMQTVTKIIESPQYSGKPKISIQVSIHNSDETRRAEHVFHQALQPAKGEKKTTLEKSKKRLLPLTKIAKQFAEIVDAQKKKGITSPRKPSLTFVCTKESSVDPVSLINCGFNAENTAIQFRPILSETPEKDSMDQDQFHYMYEQFINYGFDVVIMPVSPSGVELMSAKNVED